MSNTYCSPATLAKILNITVRRVQQLAHDGIIPKPEKGKYDLIACVTAYVKYLQDRTISKENEPQDIMAERARLLKAQADKIELEVKEMNGEVISAERVEFLWFGLITAFRAKMLAMPVRCAHKVMNFKSYPEVEGCLREHVHEALSELSRYDPEQHSSIDIEESGESDGTTAEPQDKPMGGSIPAAE